MFEKLKAVWDRMVERFRFDSAIMATLEEHHNAIYALNQDNARLTASVRANTEDVRRLRAAFRGQIEPSDLGNEE